MTDRMGGHQLKSRSDQSDDLHVIQVPNERAPPLSQQTGQRRRRLYLTFLLFALGCIVVAALNFTLNGELVMLLPIKDVEGKETKYDSNGNVPPSRSECQDRCQRQRKSRADLLFDGDDLLDTNVLLDRVQKEKQKLIAKLHVDYGKEYFEKIFVDNPNDDPEQHRYRGSMPASENGHSTETFHRKLMIKILSVQVALARQDDEATECECTPKKSNRALQQSTPPPVNITNSTVNNNNKNDDDNNNNYTLLERYVWASGGHSTSAGHGNLFNESKWAVLERDMKPLFAALGIDLEVRNYGMGGTASYFEVSSCFEQIFGSDLDFFSWDFGMTDFRNSVGILHYSYRGALNPGHPAMIALRTNDPRTEILQGLEELGLGAFASSEAGEREMEAAIPDCEGLSLEEIQAMPEYLRHFKCSNMIENGEPGCKAEKYTSYVCEKRKSKTSWHPGFKSHALDGHTLAFFLMQHLIDTLKELAVLRHDEQNENPETLLAMLKVQDDDQYKKFVRAGPIPKLAGERQKFVNVKSNPNWDEEHPDVIETIFRGPSICRTGRLPAKSRYLGYMTDNGKTGDIAILGQETYDIGIEVQEAILTSNATTSDKMRLVYADDDNKYRDYRCPVQLKADYKDFFFVHANEGWVRLTIPNEAEKEAYRYDKDKMKGLIFAHRTDCIGGSKHCPKEEIGFGAFENGQLEMTINGKPVTSIDNSIGMLKWGDQQGQYYWNATSNGDYEIMARVTEPNAYVKFSGFIVY